MLTNKEIQAIKNGDNKPLGKLYADNRKTIMKTIAQKTKGRHEVMDIEDAIQDAFFVIRKKIMNDNFVNKNVSGFIVVIAEKILLNKNRNLNRKMTFEDIGGVGAIEIYLNRIHNGDNSSITFSDDSDRLDDDQLRKVNAIRKAWKNLGVPCQRILKAVWLDEKKLKDIWEPLGYKNYDTAKSTKGRCFKKLREEVERLLKNK